MTHLSPLLYAIDILEAVKPGVSALGRWWATLSKVGNRLVFFCYIQWVALSRRLRKIFRNRYKYTKQLVFLPPVRRLTSTFKVIQACGDFRDGARCRGVRYLETLSEIAQDPEHPLILMRDALQEGGLSVLIARQVRERKS